VDVRHESYGDPAARALTAELAAELVRRYDGRGGSGGEPPASDFEPPDGVFLVGYEDGEPVACGGVCRYDGATAEIRRMHVVPAARGRRLARALLAALEEEARNLGYSTVRLETGKRQPDAIGLYESVGYGRIGRYGPYVDDDRSLCFEKAL
jgi:GNAT superfamily N-acetyltransferase